MLNRDTIIRHVKDTIALLEEQKNYRLGLIRFPSQQEEIEFAFLCKKGDYFLACNQVLKCLQEPTLINQVFAILDNDWDNIPPDYKDNLEVASRIRMLIDL